MTLSSERSASERQKKNNQPADRCLTCNFELLVLPCHAWHVQRRSSETPSVILRDDLISFLQQGQCLEPLQKACMTAHFFLLFLQACLRCSKLPLRQVAVRNNQPNKQSSFTSTKCKVITMLHCKICLLASDCLKNWSLSSAHFHQSKRPDNKGDKRRPPQGMEVFDCCV